MFLGSALHARGGGPDDAVRVGIEKGCSPRTWRWSAAQGLCAGGREVLSTHVEVVRWQTTR